MVLFKNHASKFNTTSFEAFEFKSTISPECRPHGFWAHVLFGFNACDSFCVPSSSLSFPSCKNMYRACHYFIIDFYRERNIDLSFHLNVFIGWFLYVPWWEIELSTLAYQDVLTNWLPGEGCTLSFLFCYCI